MVDIKTEKFYLKNLDCAACAAKIETGLKAVAGIDDAVLDFASLTLHVRATDIARIVEEVRKIEPGVEIISKSEQAVSHEHPSESGEIKFKRELSILIVATALFILLLFFENWFHREDFSILEIAMC